jgi:hypothetical protein
MGTESTSGDRITMSFGGSVSGQVAGGRDINQTSIQTGSTSSPEVTKEDLAALHAAIEAVKARVLSEAPDEKKSSALERVDELEQAIVAEKPDLSTMQYVRNWFSKNLPKLAGTITGLFINPVVGKIVEAAGDLAAAQFREHFGGNPPS